MTRVYGGCASVRASCTRLTVITPRKMKGARRRLVSANCRNIFHTPCRAVPLRSLSYLWLHKITSDKVNMVLNVHRNHKAYQGQGVWRCGKREIIYFLLRCHHQNDFCIKVGSDKSHFNVFISVRDKVTRQCPQTTTFEEKGEPNGFEPRSLRVPA